MEKGELVATSGRGKEALSLSKTMLNWSTLKFSQEFWPVGTKCNKAHSFVCHSTLIPCTGFQLLFTIAEELVCKCTCVFALISKSMGAKNLPQDSLGANLL